MGKVITFNGYVENPDHGKGAAWRQRRKHGEQFVVNPDSRPSTVATIGFQARQRATKTRPCGRGGANGVVRQRRLHSRAENSGGNDWYGIHGAGEVREEARRVFGRF